MSVPSMSVRDLFFCRRRFSYLRGSPRCRAPRRCLVTT
jgi:hypothetical protein